MASVVLYSIISVIIVSLITIIAAIPIYLKKKISQKHLVILLSISVGSLLGSVFIHFIPQIYKHEHKLESALFIILGFVVFFILEKLIHWHHSKKCEKGECGHGHAYHLAPLNLIGDGIHNFLDGMVIAGSYIVSIPLGIAATTSIIFHELPQEIADFGILIYSGMNKTKALLFNFLSGLTAILRTILGLFLAGKSGSYSEFIIPFAAGNFLYIAASNLVPELHRHCKLWDTVAHIIAIAFGVSIMVAVSLFFPAHIH